MLLKKAHLNDITVTNLSQSFTHKMAVKTSWHRYGTKLRHCHPVYTRVAYVVCIYTVSQKKQDT